MVDNRSQTSPAKPTDDTYRDYCLKNLQLLRQTIQITYEKDPSKYSCPKCLGKGRIYVFDDSQGDIVAAKCDCYQSKTSQALARTSGFGFMLETYRFDNFITDNETQKKMLTLARSFCNDDDAHWFFLGGQSGVGKTHVCTAIASFYIDKGISTKYICWNSWSANLKKLFNNSSEYYRIFDEALNARVLFIDDLFKGATSRATQPTDADIKLAFEIINGRYLSTDKVTILSSEFFMGDLITIDEGTFSRVYQGCGKYQFNIKRDKGQNFRTQMAMQKVLQDRRS